MSRSRFFSVVHATGCQSEHVAPEDFSSAQAGEAKGCIECEVKSIHFVHYGTALLKALCFSCGHLGPGQLWFHGPSPYFASPLIFPVSSSEVFVIPPTLETLCRGSNGSASREPSFVSGLSLREPWRA